MITKLESLLEKTLKDTQRAREGLLELEKLRTENMELQEVLRNGNGAPVYGKGGPLSGEYMKPYQGVGGGSEVDRLRNEVALLENLVAELRAELKNKRPTTPGTMGGNNGGDWEDVKIDLEVRL